MAGVTRVAVATTLGVMGVGSLKPASFEYRRPTSLEEAAALLREHYGEAKILAGGQTLVPMLNFRLAAPSILVDINEIEGLDRIELRHDGLELGALVRWHQIEASRTVHAANPLLTEAVKHIAHYQIRNRGTWAGSSAHADPAAEFPAVAIICGARFGIYSTREKRTIEANDFFVGPLTTVLEPDEILTDVRFPAWPAGRQWGFEEFALRPGDFALAGVATLIDGIGDAVSCRLVCFGVGEKPSRLAKAEGVIASEGLTRNAIARAAVEAAAEVDAQIDIHASAEYRRALVEALVERTVLRAAGLGPVQ
jgi:carbon-monoxide dehydrogenase medium subunit